ncbi:MAG: galactokinase [Chloroflexi bacterium]|nr:galactokinase [Chloroflexota bacterium]
MIETKREPIRILSPGRVNLLGEHVDYNDGLVLPAAIDRVITITATRRADQVLSLNALDLGQSLQIPLKSVEKKLDIHGDPLPSWALYPAGVAWTLSSSGYEVCGLDCEYSSNIPIGAGLSSSAAVEVGFAVLWQALGGWSMDRLRLAQLCQKAEIEYAGVRCGLMDQFACANGVEGHAVLLDTRSLAFRSVPLPKNMAIVIADSSIRRSLVTSAYNDRRRDCETALSILKQTFPEVRSLRDVTLPQFKSMQGKMEKEVFIHARHVVEEIERVFQAIPFLEQGASEKFGQLMFDTHSSLRDLFEVSCPELDILVEIAASLDGCIGARLTGAGFGGCTVNLVEQTKAEAFVHELSKKYRERTSRVASVFITRASSSAHEQPFDPLIG